MGTTWSKSQGHVCAWQEGARPVQRCPLSTPHTPGMAPSICSFQLTQPLPPGRPWQAWIQLPGTPGNTRECWCRAGAPAGGAGLLGGPAGSQCSLEAASAEEQGVGAQVRGRVSVTGWPCPGAMWRSIVGQEAFAQGAEPPVRRARLGLGLGSGWVAHLTVVRFTGRKRRTWPPWPRGTWGPCPFGPLSVPQVEQSGLRPPQLGDHTGLQALVVMTLPKAEPRRPPSFEWWQLPRLSLPNQKSGGLPENLEVPPSGPSHRQALPERGISEVRGPALLEAWGGGAWRLSPLAVCPSQGGRGDFGMKGGPGRKGEKGEPVSTSSCPLGCGQSGQSAEADCPSESPQEDTQLPWHQSPSPHP